MKNLDVHNNAKNQVNPYHHTQKIIIDKLMQTADKPKMVVASVHDEAAGRGVATIEATEAAASPKNYY